MSGKFSFPFRRQEYINRRIWQRVHHLFLYLIMHSQRLHSSDSHRKLFTTWNWRISNPFGKRFQYHKETHSHVQQSRKPQCTIRNRRQFSPLLVPFFYKYIRYIEAGALEKLQEIIIRDYPTFSGHALEEYFKCRFREKGEFTALGGYWNRKGEDEIDLIALDEIEKKAVVAEIKRNRQNIKMDALMLKGASIQKELNGYSVEYRGLSMEDM